MHSGRFIQMGTAMSGYSTIHLPARTRVSTGSVQRSAPVLSETSVLCIGVLYALFSSTMGAKCERDGLMMGAVWCFISIRVKGNKLVAIISFAPLDCNFMLPFHCLPSEANIEHSE